MQYLSGWLSYLITHISLSSLKIFPSADKSKYYLTNRTRCVQWLHFCLTSCNQRSASGVSFRATPIHSLYQWY